MVEVIFPLKEMTLRQRVQRALENVEDALNEPGAELQEKITLTGKEYLENQRLLLKTLLKSKTW